MKRKGGLDVIIALGPAPKKKGPPMMDMEEPDYEEEMEMEEEMPSDMDAMKQERMDLLEERIRRLESMLMEEDEEEDEEEYEDEDEGYSY
jgi:hypothetical protein